VVGVPLAAAETTANFIGNVSALPSTMLFYPVGRIFNRTRQKAREALTGLPPGPPTYEARERKKGGAGAASPEYQQAA
jgi:hypothetical protein